MRWLISALLLTAVYLLMLSSLHPLDVMAGLVLSVVLLVSFRTYLGWTRTGDGPPLAERLLWLFPFVLRVVWEVAVGTFRVAAMVTHLRPLAQTKFVEIPVDDYTPGGIAVSALVITLSPGSVLVDVDSARHVMLLHVLDDATPEEIQSAVRSLYLKYQRHVFP